MVHVTSEQHGAELVLDKVTKTYGGRSAVDEVSLAVEPREFVTLLGPSGSGKTTVLRMIGGFVSPDAGRILIDGSDVAGVPVERRPTAMLFQQLSLWPHLSVARNVSFGLEIRRRSKREIDQRVGELLEIVGLADFGARLPSQLSGGEQQRVALARALALEPRILLLDEPFSALDTMLRTELRTFVRGLQREVGTTMMLVTHDQEEALELSDRIVVMHSGRVEQIGAPTDIYDAPQTAFVAEFLGTMNFVTGSLTGHGVALSGGPVVHIVDPGAASREPVRIGVRPEDVVVDEESGDAVFVVEAVISKGHYQQLTIRWHGGVLTSYVEKGTAVRPGDCVGVRFRHVHIFPEEAVAGLADDIVEGVVGEPRACGDSIAKDPVLSHREARAMEV
jgi:putative spermidine/putrescine transport system ATP-binding protein